MECTSDFSNKLLQRDWTALYGAAGHDLDMLFTRILRKWVWLVRLIQMLGDFVACSGSYYPTVMTQDVHDEPKTSTYPSYIAS